MTCHMLSRQWFVSGNYLHGGLGLAAGAWGYVAATSVQSYLH